VPAIEPKLLEAEGIRSQNRSPEDLGAWDMLKATGYARKVMQQRFGLTNGHRMYVACLAQAGEIDEARAALARLQELHPENSIAWIESNIPYPPGPMAKFLEGMRKAGLE
jgi:adenylate cyclase